MSGLQQRDDVVIETLGDELLIFDATSNRAHSLNTTAATVWNACNGVRDRDAITQATGLSADVVDLALGYLRDCNLLLPTTAEPTEPRVSRRSAIRKAAITGAGFGIALPVIRSITAPSPAQAQGASGFTCPGVCEYDTSCCCFIPGEFGGPIATCTAASFCGNISNGAYCISQR